VVLYIALFIFIAVQSRVTSWQDGIAAYFYPDHERRKRQFYSALATARRERCMQAAVDDDALGGAAQKEVLRDLMCVGVTGGQLGTVLSMRRAAAAVPMSSGRRCVACGQPVSRRLRKMHFASTRRLSNDDCLDCDVCPVCDCRLTSDDDIVYSNAACCISTDLTPRIS